ncbi:leucine-rich repeat-containing protein 71 [Stegastes partitus]|uniref:Leucine-rich repeat-containing protein 71 n=1 Tax=Stegastes partitus TaxID=144197 RepID=A0A9Y4N183_9TELE|nr:PREDICTED: leucine-rich repeat-containing protein 71 [Stegastes partitus]
MPRKRQAKEKTNAEDEASKNTGQTPTGSLPVQTFDEYQCSGNVEADFPGLCALLDMKNIPTVCTKHPTSSAAKTEGEDGEDNQSKTSTAPFWWKPCLKVELESEDPLGPKNMKISGWKVNKQIFRVLQKMLPSVSQLQSLQFWQAGLTDQMLISLVNTISLCSALKVVKLEGSVLPEQSYHLLLSEDSLLTHLSLRNNRIGDEGARLIGSALSTSRSANKNLMSLNLAFNSIGDAGATHIAKGLRLNRALLFLSLSSNQIGDSGAAHLAAILGKFALTHEEVVERRKLLLQRAQAEASKKEEKSAANKEKSSKKTSEAKTPRGKGGEPGGRERQSSAHEAELVEAVNPLLDKSVHHRDGEVFLPGNTILHSLNLAGNRITEKSLPLFLASLETQAEGRGGLWRLCLQRNLFPPECECYTKIKELMDCSAQKDRKEEGQEASH